MDQNNYVDDDICKCTSENCPYISSCARKTLSSINTSEVSYFTYDFSYNCNSDSGFQDYIKTII